MNAPLPRIIQGGMGVAVSSWRLARAVSTRGQLGVVSGTGIDTVIARRLQMGDPGGHLRTAFDAFPVPEIARRVWDRHYIEGGKAPGAAYKSKAVPSIKMPLALLDLILRTGRTPSQLVGDLHEAVGAVWHYDRRDIRFDADRRFAVEGIVAEEPAECIAGAVLQGHKKPFDCPAFGVRCDPENPLGAPMVSAEGACAAYYRYQRD